MPRSFNRLRFVRALLRRGSLCTCCTYSRVERMAYARRDPHCWRAEPGCRKPIGRSARCFDTGAGHTLMCSTMPAEVQPITEALTPSWSVRRVAGLMTLKGPHRRTPDNRAGKSDL